MATALVPSPLKLESKDVFALDGRIRWTAYGDVHGKIFFSEVRPGLTPVLALDRIRDLLRMRAEYLTEIARRVEPFVGRARYVITAYEPYIEVIVTREDRYLAISVNPDTPLSDTGPIVALIGKLNF